ncbi:helix-turn-helix domain-containing protein [Rubinisphaera italica]|uniref:Helix-turn-helix protein n=1 Tax=Rubinisphaera italica TaxID=2527969 RepID=A0A5C5XJ29_9PLAN|nr:helix-turn-helix transcriptional regulator [Rubinisphaera italica]TWT63177.1 helix-turn-helix protein [Rubinisphaera italica]
MKKKVKRVKSHPKLTPAKQAELKQAAESEQLHRFEPAVKAHDLRMKQMAINKRLLKQLATQLDKVKSEHKFSLADLSDRSGIDRPSLSRLLNGKAENPTIETLSRVAEALGKRISIELLEKK